MNTPDSSHPGFFRRALSFTKTGSAARARLVLFSARGCFSYFGGPWLERRGYPDPI